MSPPLRYPAPNPFVLRTSLRLVGWVLITLGHSTYLKGTHVRVSRGVRAKQGDQHGRKACLEGGVGYALAFKCVCF
jgi:hypothetical protein